ncbi:MAG: sugar phosphate nucleotidyltransferase, partial [Planctomycetota bacterium]|nr:sugar phosphate nucleotidyltransferase [Planctomycetota bacterium]
GYIERGAPAGGAFHVDRFREKPGRETAEEFLRTGRFYWNSGIFLWRAARVLELLKQYQPAIVAGLERLKPAWGTPDWTRALAEEFPKMPSISIDYAVLEPVAAAGTEGGGVYVLPSNFEWDDVGSWQSLPAVLGKDEQGNTSVGPTCALHSTGCVIRTTDDHLVATIGLRDCVVVHTPDATLVAPRDDENALRELVATLEKRGLAHYL